MQSRFDRTDEFAQVLVTEDDFRDLKRYSILRQTFERLLKLGTVANRQRKRYGHQHLHGAGADIP